MFTSIIDDIKTQFRSGNMITKLIFINIGIWAIMALIQSFAPSSYATLFSYVALSGNVISALVKPWTFITHIFVHSGFWHVAWNMLTLYWFGRIVGDLVGDKHILPLFFTGALSGAVAYIVSYAILPSYIGAFAVGASAGIMAIVMAAGRIAPDYEMRLILIGPVKLKYIVMALIFFDLVGAGGSSNTGGHIAHLAGVAAGWLFVGQLGNNNDITQQFHRLFKWLNPEKTVTTPPKPFRNPNMSVAHRSEKLGKTREEYSEETLNKVLEKIKASGLNSLTKKEKEILAEASKRP